MAFSSPHVPLKSNLLSYNSTTLNSTVRGSFLLLRFVPSVCHRCGAMSLCKEQTLCEEAIPKTCFVIVSHVSDYPPPWELLLLEEEFQEVQELKEVVGSRKQWNGPQRCPHSNLWKLNMLCFMVKGKHGCRQTEGWSSAYPYAGGLSGINWVGPATSHVSLNVEKEGRKLSQSDVMWKGLSSLLLVLRMKEGTRSQGCLPWLSPSYTHIRLLTCSAVK